MRSRYPDLLCHPTRPPKSARICFQTGNPAGRRHDRQEPVTFCRRDFFCACYEVSGHRYKENRREDSVCDFRQRIQRPRRRGFPRDRYGVGLPLHAGRRSAIHGPSAGSVRPARRSDMGRASGLFLTYASFEQRPNSPGSHSGNAGSNPAGGIRPLRIMARSPGSHSGNAGSNPAGGIRPLRIMARSPAFQAGNAGSIPAGAIAASYRSQVHGPLTPGTGVRVPVPPLKPVRTMAVRLTLTQKIQVRVLCRLSVAANRQSKRPRGVSAGLCLFCSFRTD